MALENWLKKCITSRYVWKRFPDEIYDTVVEEIDVKKDNIWFNMWGD